MKWKTLIISLCLLCVVSAFAQVPLVEEAPYHESVPALRKMVSGAMGYLRRILDPVETGSLPRNEARASELDSGEFQADFFVPAQLGYWMTAAVLSHALRTQDPSFTRGFTTDELLAQLDSTVAALENILAHHAFTDQQTGKKALYQVHKIGAGEAPRGTDFEATVSLLDNTFVVVSLHVASAYVRPLAPDLADRLDLILGNFDLGMWVQNGQMFLGAPENPRAGSRLDRLVSEGRLAVVAGRARDEISEQDFAAILNTMRTQSMSGSTPGGITVAQLPFFGTALEIWAVTPFLSSELKTLFGAATLLPLLEAWQETRVTLDLPAAGAMGIADGFGDFKVFAFSPAEGVAPHLDARVLVPPAAGVQAAIGTSSALQNLEWTMVALEDAGQFDAEYGAPNYLDFDTGLVNESDPVRGTLEIGQMAVALLNYLLGGTKLETLLRVDQGWNTALEAYTNFLDTIEREAEDNSGGTCAVTARSNASGEQTCRVENPGDEVSYTITLDTAGEYTLFVRYSNDDTGVGDSITVLVDGAAVGGFRTVDTKQPGDPPGAGWNRFVDSDSLVLGMLSGEVELALRLETTDGFGIEYDKLTLSSEMLPPPPPPVLDRPADGAEDVSTDPSLRWNAAPGADSYAVQIATDSSFTNLVVDQSSLTSTFFDGSGLEAETEHFWHVNASNAGGTSDWSETRSFTTAAPPSTDVIEQEAEDGFMGPCTVTARSNASGEQTCRVENAGDEVSYTITLDAPGEYALTVRYSNDHTGVGDSVTVLVNGNAVGGFRTMDTKQSGDPAGAGWNRFVDADSVALGTLWAGEVELGLRMETTDGFGLEYDKLTVSLERPVVVAHEREAEDNTGGTCVVTARSNASGEQTCRVKNVGDEVSYRFALDVAGTYAFMVRYSNDDTGVGDSVTVLVNGNAVGGFRAQDTKQTGDSEGEGWNRFVDAPMFKLKMLAVGEVEIGLRMETTDGSGLEYDKLALSLESPVAVERVSGEVPRAFHLAQNYPNPFNPTTTIPFDLSRPSDVTLKVYDMTGREVATLVSGPYPAGRYETAWDASGVASGVYLYRLQAGAFSTTRRLIVLK